jgi:hypothetical protein
MTNITEYMAMAAMKPCMDRNNKKAPVGRPVLFAVCDT